jgi:thioredoxin reductase (NADPH)
MAAKNNYTPNEKTLYDTVIIGTGVVGWAAAMYSGRLGMKTLVIGNIHGGTISLTHIVENYPGFISLTGNELAKKVEEHAKNYDIDILNSQVEKVSKKGKIFAVYTKKQTFSTKTIIFATGARLKRLGVLGEKEYNGRGVSYCALCDGPLFVGKTLGVVGGSDSAVKEAILLSEYAKKVYVIYRGEKVHPEKPTLKMLDEKIKKKKIEVIKNVNIIEIKGDGEVMKSVIFDKPYKGKKEFELGGLFVYIGHEPISELAKSIGVKTNQGKEIIINRNSETNIKGVFAAGDVVDTHFKQAITGVGEGVAASYHAYEYVRRK